MKNRNQKPPFAQLRPSAPTKTILSPGGALAAMKDGREYESLISLPGTIELDPLSEIRLAMADIEAIRNRPLILYAANVVNTNLKSERAITGSDDLPFNELLGNCPRIPGNKVDFCVVTPGGSGQQTAQFVANTRRKFDDVGFIVPYMAMSAGTIWAMSANEIIMTGQSYLGPTDPQVQGRDGRFVPAQAILTAIKEMQTRGAANQASGRHPDWTDIALLQNIDAKEIGNAISQSKYSVDLVSEFLKKYKFSSWTHHSDGRVVTDSDKSNTAKDIAERLCSHDTWKMHSHGISREVLNDEVKLMIVHSESIQGLDRAIKRLWALLYWFFENSTTIKIFGSQNYMLARAEKA